MASWTTTPQEYDHVRSIIFLSTDLTGKRVRVLLKNGVTLEGIPVGSNSGTDVGQNLDAGRGPIVTAMYGEVRLLIDNGHTLAIDARTIEVID